MTNESFSWCWKKSGIFGKSKCAQTYHNETATGLCPPVWDGFLCWPPTMPGSTVQLQCPRKPGNDVTKFAFRVCQASGTWSQNPSKTILAEAGWTNYQPCFNNYTLHLMRRLLGSSNSTEELMSKTSIASHTRILEMVGLIISALSLIVALIVFGRFRNLWNNRTRIHKNLFIAMTIQVLVRLVLYIDQYVDHKVDFECYTLQRLEYTCESAYTILEYAKTSMFLWMFIEGLYLHNMITVAVFQEHLSFSFYYLVGWGTPVILTAIWTIMTANEFHGVACWLGYNFSTTYMVLEGPRLVVIFLNLFFLLNIMRVLVTKLRESNSTEAQQVRKAVRAAIVLLPLLGITNFIQMVHSPIEKSPLEFGIWSYGTTFLSTFQGFFCSLIYCFLNGEVQIQVRRYIRAKRHRKSAGPRRKSLAPGASMINHINFNIRGDSKKLDILGGSSSKGSHSKLEKELQGKHTIMEAGAAGLVAGASIIGDCASEEENSRNSGNMDPFYENWDEAELSSHNNVIIELVEVPHCIMQGNGKTNVKKIPGTPASSSISVHTAKNSATIPFMDNSEELTNVINDRNSTEDDDDENKAMDVHCNGETEKVATSSMEGLNVSNNR